MRNNAFEGTITDAWSEALAFGMRITRAQIRQNGDRGVYRRSWLLRARG